MLLVLILLLIEGEGIHERGRAGKAGGVKRETRESTRSALVQWVAHLEVFLLLIHPGALERCVVILLRDSLLAHGLLPHGNRFQAVKAKSCVIIFRIGIHMLIEFWYGMLEGGGLA